MIVCYEKGVIYSELPPLYQLCVLPYSRMLYLHCEAAHQASSCVLVDNYSAV